MWITSGVKWLLYVPTFSHNKEDMNTSSIIVHPSGSHLGQYYATPFLYLLWCEIRTILTLKGVTGKVLLSVTYLRHKPIIKRIQKGSTIPLKWYHLEIKNKMNQFSFDCVALKIASRHFRQAKEKYCTCNKNVIDTVVPMMKINRNFVLSLNYKGNDSKHFCCLFISVGFKNFFLLEWRFSYYYCVFQLDSW